MKAPDMATITESLERSLQNFSLSSRNDDRKRSEEQLGRSPASSSSSSSTNDNNIAIANNHVAVSDTTLELNSHLSLPYHWEQCLDLKTGEIYYINWKNGMKVKEDPRLIDYSYYTEEDSSYDSEESSSESSPSSAEATEKEEDNVLVVAGCKACFMYFMVPKLVEDCPKCSGQLLHFDRPDNASP